MLPKDMTNIIQKIWSIYIKFSYVYVIYIYTYVCQQVTRKVLRKYQSNSTQNSSGSQHFLICVWVPVCATLACWSEHCRHIHAFQQAFQANRKYTVMYAVHEMELFSKKNISENLKAHVDLKTKTRTHTLNHHTWSRHSHRTWNSFHHSHRIHHSHRHSCFHIHRTCHTFQAKILMFLSWHLTHLTRVLYNHTVSLFGKSWVA